MHRTGPEGPIYFAALTARLKSCPDTSCSVEAVFPQPVKHIPTGPYPSRGFCRLYGAEVVFGAFPRIPRAAACSILGYSHAPSGSSQSFGGGELFGRGVLSPGVAEAVLIFHRPSEVGSPGRALFPGFLWVAVRGLRPSPFTPRTKTCPWGPRLPPFWRRG